MTVSAKREARVELKSSAAGMDRGINDARRKLRQFEREQARAARQAERDAKAARKQMLSAGRGVLGSVKDGLGLGLGLQAAGGLTGMADGVLDYEKALTRLQITTNSTPDAMRLFSRTVEQASNKTGINRNEVLSAASAYVALTGDMDTARASTGTWAKIAAATGSTVSDIATTAAALSQQMGIGPADMEATFSALAQQGKAGAIELKDLAGTMSQIAPMWGMFKGGKGIQGVRELGAALQVVKRGFGGDAGETVTGLQGLLVSLQKNAKRFKDGGIRVFDVDKNGKETMRDVFSIVDAISKSSLVNHPDLLEKAFGRVEAYRAYLQLSQNRDALAKFVKESGDAGLIQRDFGTYAASAAGKIEMAWTNAKNAIAAAFTPERIELFARALTKAVDILAKIVGFIDRAASFISDVTGLDGPQIEERGEAVYKKGKALTDSMNLDVAGQRRMAATLADQAAHVYEKPGGMNEADEVLHYALTKEANELRLRSDPWNQASGKIDAERLAPGTGIGGGLGPETVKWVLTGMRDDIARAIRDGFAGIPIKIGAEPIAKAAKNASTLRTRPGGRV